MTERLGGRREMSDVPKLDLTGSLAEIWFQVSYAAYHMAYVRVYSQSAALRTNIEQMRRQDAEARMQAQTDVVVCRTHLAAFFWYLDHAFEALRTAISRGQKEHPEIRRFWTFERQLGELEKKPLRGEIKDYRNMSHENPGIIGCSWDANHNFLYHFLPVINGHERTADLELNEQLQQYFEFVVNVWLDFVPGDFREAFPRDFTFPVTVPFMFTGELPEALSSAPQLHVTLQSYTRMDPPAPSAQETSPGR
jgi:hypothetical protein